MVVKTSDKNSHRATCALFGQKTLTQPKISVIHYGITAFERTPHGVTWRGQPGTAMRSMPNMGGNYRKTPESQIKIVLCPVFIHEKPKNELIFVDSFRLIVFKK